MTFTSIRNRSRVNQSNVDTATCKVIGAPAGVRVYISVKSKIRLQIGDGIDRRLWWQFQLRQEVKNGF